MAALSDTTLAFASSGLMIAVDRKVRRSLEAAGESSVEPRVRSPAGVRFGGEASGVSIGGVGERRSGRFAS